MVCHISPVIQLYRHLRGPESSRSSVNSWSVTLTAVREWGLEGLNFKTSPPLVFSGLDLALLQAHEQGSAGRNNRSQHSNLRNTAFYPEVMGIKDLELVRHPHCRDNNCCTIDVLFDT